jgi:hypothetical protein
MSSSFARPLNQRFGRRDLAVALLHQLGEIHIQLLSQVSERPELPGAVLPNGHAECIRRLVGLSVSHG